MSDPIKKFGDNVLVKCPGCFAEVPADEGPQDPSAAWRCQGCRMRGTDIARRFAEQQQRESAYEQGKSGSNASAKPAPSRRRESRDKPPQPESNVGGMDPERVDKESNSGEA